MGRNAQSSADFEDDASEMFKCHQETSIKQKDPQEGGIALGHSF